MSFLLLVFDPALVAVSMAIVRTGTTADAAPVARSAAEDAGAGLFLDP
ncbi:hypothetical protein [Litoreibacter roseus]|nr:hypothetical protein [Litoreibacter roseus]